MNRRIAYRQGDVLLTPADEIPKGAALEKQEGARLIIQRGEVTGHHHSVALADAEMLTASEAERYLRVERETALSHQEHATISVPPGAYRITIQREYQPRKLPRYAAD